MIASMYTYVKDAMQCLNLNVTKCEDSNAGGLCGALEEFDNRILNLSAKPYRVMTSFRIDSLKHMQLHNKTMLRISCMSHFMLFSHDDNLQRGTA